MDLFPQTMDVFQEPPSTSASSHFVARNPRLSPRESTTTSVLVPLASQLDIKKRPCVQDAAAKFDQQYTSASSCMAQTLAMLDKGVLLQ